jgi:hypothetical protein
LLTGLIYFVCMYFVFSRFNSIPVYFHCDILSLPFVLYLFILSSVFNFLYFRPFLAYLSFLHYISFVFFFRSV